MINLEKSKILDLFSGVGSFGVRMYFKRSSKCIVFCENYPEAIKILKKNIINLNVNKKLKLN